MPFQAVLFDLDGTLLNTYEDLADSLNAVLAELGRPTVPAEVVKDFIGGGVDVLVRRALGAEASDEAAARCAERFREEYGKRWACKTRPYDGVVALIDSLGKRGIRIGVYSNKPDPFTRLCVAKFLPMIAGEYVLGAQPAIPKKPDPAGARLVAERLGSKPADMLYLGDSATDMETATAAGMYAVGATWGYRSADELRTHGARVLIDHPNELLNLLD